MLSERDPAALPWGDLGVDVVLESTGFFTTREGAQKHLDAGAKKVDHLRARDRPRLHGRARRQRRRLRHERSTTSSRTPRARRTASRRSRRCSTISPGSSRGFMTTIHAYTNDQSILDMPHKDLRRARAAAINLIPTSTGAAKAIGLVLPHLKGKLDGVAVRAPVADRIAHRSRRHARARGDSRTRSTPPTRRRPPGRSPGILQYSDDPLVSTRHRRSSPYSCIFDSELTMAHGAPRRCSAGTTTSGATAAGSSTSFGEAARVRRRRAPSRRPTSPASACSSGPTSTSRSRTARSPTTRASARRCRRCAGSSTTAPREVVVCSHLGRPKTDEDRERRSRSRRSQTRLRELAPRRAHPRAREHPLQPRRDEERRRATRASSPTGMDLYVNDAFGSAHRAHCSTEAVAHLLPAYAGLLLLAELEHLGRLLGEVEHPFVLVAGGAKVDDKLAVLEHLGGRADTVLIGGKMAEQLRDAQPAVVPGRAARRTSSRPRRSRTTPSTGSPRRRRARRAGSGSTSGPQTAEAFGDDHPRRTHGLLERPDGRVRVGRVRRGYARRRRGGRATPTRTPSSAAATRCARSRSSASPTGSRGSRPVAARRSSCSRAASCPAWRRSRRHEMKAHRRQLEDVQGPGRDARVLRRVRGARRRRGRALPAVRLARGRGRRGVADLRAERPLGRRGRVHRRDLGAHARRARRRRERSSATPSGGSYFGETDETVRLARRGGARRRPRRDRVRRRDRGRARGRTRPRQCCAGRSRCCRATSAS